MIDFGLAEDEYSDENQSYTKTILGNVDYLSPERVDGFPGTMESDLFALGIILYELCFLKHPFKSDSDFKTMEAIKYKEIDLNPIDESYLEFKNILSTLLRKDKQRNILALPKKYSLIQKSYIFSKYRVYVGSLITLVVILTIYFIFSKSDYNSIIYNKETNSPIKPSETIKLNGFSIEACTFFNYESIGKLSMIFRKVDYDQFVKSKFKRTAPEAIAEVATYLNRVNDTYNKVYSLCNKVENTKFVKKIYDLYYERLQALQNMKADKKVKSVLSNYQSEFALDARVIQTQPYPGYYTVEKSAFDIIKSLKNNHGIINGKYIYFLNNELLPNRLSNTQCQMLSEFYIIHNILGDPTKFQSINGLKIILFNNNNTKIDLISEKIIVSKKDKESFFCVYEANNIENAEINFY